MRWDGRRKIVVGSCGKRRNERLESASVALVLLEMTWTAFRSQESCFYCKKYRQSSADGEVVALTLPRFLKTS